jgi:hypothetical protein
MVVGSRGVLVLVLALALKTWRDVQAKGIFVVSGFPTKCPITSMVLGKILYMKV